MVPHTRRPSAGHPADELALSCLATDIAITGHRRCLTALFAILHHRDIRLAQGEIIPAVIKVTKKQQAGEDK